MFKFIFKNRNKEGTQDDYLAPETMPIIYSDIRTITLKESVDAPTGKIHYKLIGKRRRESSSGSMCTIFTDTSRL